MIDSSASSGVVHQRSVATSLAIRFASCHRLLSGDFQQGRSSFFSFAHYSIARRANMAGDALLIINRLSIDNRLGELPIANKRLMKRLATYMHPPKMFKFPPKMFKLPPKMFKLPPKMFKT